jgi:diacylglycerol kinase (ATP)
MRASVVFGPDVSEKNLKPFQKASRVEWRIGLPSDPAEADAILIFGGDGTLHRHLPSLVRLQLPVLVVPCGSGNDFARALHLRSEKTSLRAWQEFTSRQGNVVRIDLGVITPASNDSLHSQPHYFCCVAGVGLDAEVARRANRLPRWLRGNGGYVLSLPAALFGFTATRMRLKVLNPKISNAMIADAESAVLLAAFANAPSYGGGMKIAPHAKLTDGELDLCIVHDMGRLKLFCLFPTIYLGKHIAIRGVEYMKTLRLALETQTPLDVYADGEYVCRTPIEVSVARNALPVIAGPPAGTL